MAEAETPAAVPTNTDPQPPAETSTASLLHDGEPAKQEATTEPAKQADKQTPEKDAKPPEVPEKYELKLPEGTVIDDGLMTEFQGWAKEMKFTAEQAQKAADLHLKVIGAFAQKQAEEFSTRLDAWKKEFTEDKDLQGSVEVNGKPTPKGDVVLSNALKVLNAFGTKEEVAALKAELDRTGLGNFRVLIKGLAKFAEVVGDDNVVFGKPSTSQERTAAEVMYGGKSA